jgi:hypothetical protein
MGAALGKEPPNTGEYCPTAEEDLGYLSAVSGRMVEQWAKILLVSGSPRTRWLDTCFIVALALDPTEVLRIFHDEYYVSLHNEVGKARGPNCFRVFPNQYAESSLSSRRGFWFPPDEGQ